jgi:hypothetical protein
MLLLAKYRVHRPTASNVGTGATKVIEDVRVVTTSVFEGVGEDGEALWFQYAGWKYAVVVNELSEG